MQHRSLQKEQLDNLDLDGQVLHQTLSELAVINRYFGNYRAMRKAILQVIQTQKKQHFRIIDMGCGGGDVLLFLAKTCQKKGIKASFLGIDGNKNSLTFAAKSAVGFSEIKLMQADVLSKDFKLPECDILITSHFLYHFDNQQLTAFLNKQKSVVKIAIISSELQRSLLAFWLFKLAAPFLNLSKLTQQDGLLAIKRAFSKKELEDLVKNTNMENFSVVKRLMFRLSLTIYTDAN